MKKIKIALVGNTNAGKTTFLNSIAGIFQETSNYPGTTVEIFKAKVIEKNTEYQLIDLPGTYSLSPYTEEEKVTQDFLLNEKYDLIVHIFNPNAKRRSLAFLLELMEIGVPIFLVLNYKNKTTCNANFFLEGIWRKLGVKGVAVNAIQKETKTIFFNSLKQSSAEDYRDICKKVHFSLKEEFQAIQKKLGLTNCFEVLRIIEIGQNPKIDWKDKDYALEIRQNRFYFIEKYLSQYFSNSKSQLKSSLYYLSDKIDKILLNSWIGVPLFFLVMWSVFQITFVLGAWPMELLDLAVSWVQNNLYTILPHNLYSSVLIDGVIGGVGAVLIFLPNIFLLFLSLAILKQSGYLARTAYLFDRLMQKVGLGGRSFVPLLMGFGCSVPAIMATRTLNSRSERIITSLMIPFMSCGARLPIYALFIAAFFTEQWRGTLLFSLYFLGILMSLFTGFLFKKIIKVQPHQFILELPEYYLPKIRNIWNEVWFALKSFISKAGMFILPISVLIWFLFTFPQINQEQTLIENSYGAQLGQILEPVFQPLGFDWRITTGLISGLGAKELFLTTFGTLYALESGDDAGLLLHLQNDPIFSPLVALSLLVFILLYTPCLAVIGVFKQEFGIKWAIVALVYPTALAWIVSFLIYQTGLIFF